MDQRPDAPTRRQTVATLTIGTVALLMLGLQPILLGELVARQRITMEGVGLVAMGEIVTLGLGILLGGALPITRMRRIAALGIATTAGLDLVSMGLAGDAAFTGVRALAGLSEGILVWISTCTIVRSAKPDRLAAIYLVAQTIAQAAVAAILAAWIVPAGGWPAGFLLLAAITLALLLLVPLMAPRLAPLADAARNAAPLFSHGGVLALAIAFFQMSAIGSLWAYLDPLGRGTGLSAEFVQLLVALVLALQVVGGSVASVAVPRLPMLLTLAAALLVQTACMAGLATPGLPALPFALMCSVYGFIWLFSMPCHIRLALHADPLGRLAQLVPGFQLLGVAFGPLLSAAFVNGEDARAVPWVSAAFALCAVLLLLVGRAKLRPAVAAPDRPAHPA